MSVNDPKAGQAPNNLRLSKLANVPAIEDLGFVMTLATNNPRNIVELPWKTAENPHQYTIKVTCALSLEEPRWMLHVGGVEEPETVLWNYDTPDFHMIAKLIHSELERGVPQQAPPGGIAPGAQPGMAPPAYSTGAQQPGPGFTTGGQPAIPSNPFATGAHPPIPVQGQAALGPQHAAPPPVPGRDLGIQAFGAAAASVSQSANLPTSRMFTMPDPALVKASPAERLVDRATSAESAHQAMQTGPLPRIPVPLPTPVKFDRQAVDQVYRLLTEPDLAFLSHGALMFFTVREFSRYQRHNCPFSVMRFELDIVSGTHWEPMPRSLVKDVCKQLFGVMRPLDLIGHYEGNDYAILLPHTGREEAIGVARRLHELLSSMSAGPGLAPGQSQIFCGVATVPDDCQHPGVAIAAALEAKNKAKAAGRAFLGFSELGHSGG